jgi:hypothetical protein
MEVNVVIFRLPPGTPNPKLGSFLKKLYGQETSSWQGRYKYRRRGLLDEIPHRKLLRGVVILREKDLEKVLEFLKEWEAQVEVRRIRPTPEDLTMLRKTT